MKNSVIMLKIDRKIPVEQIEHLKHELEKVFHGRKTIAVLPYGVDYCAEIVGNTHDDAFDEVEMVIELDCKAGESIDDFLKRAINTYVVKKNHEIYEQQRTNKAIRLAQVKRSEQKQCLKLLQNRLIHKYGEDEFCDYMRTLDTIVKEF